MRTKLCAVALVLFGLNAEGAMAGDDPANYVALRVGVSSLEEHKIVAVNPRVSRVVGGSRTDSETLWSAAVGRKLKGPLRLELEYSDRTRAHFRVDTLGGSPANGTDFNGTNDLRVSSNALMANAIREFGSCRIRPYLQAGIGLAQNRAMATQSFQNPTFMGPQRTGTSWFERKETDLAWSLGGGGTWEIEDNFLVDLGYRYVDLGRYDLGADLVNRDETIAASLISHDFTLGMRIGF